jgi:hypothetical protein
MGNLGDPTAEREGPPPPRERFQGGPASNLTFRMPQPELISRVKMPRHTIRHDALDATARANVEALRGEEKNLAAELWALLWRAAAHAGNIPSESLLDEALLRLRIESINQRLDQYSALPPPGPALDNSELPRPLRSLREVYAAVTAACGDDFSLDRALLASGDEWSAMTTIQRAWTVNNLVIDMFETEPKLIQLVDRVLLHEAVAAVNKDAQGWERLRASCLSNDEREQQAAEEARSAAVVQAVDLQQSLGPWSPHPTPSEEIDASPPANSAQRTLPGRLGDVQRLWHEGLTDSQIADALIIKVTTVRNYIRLIRKKHGNDLAPHRRQGNYPARSGSSG